MARRRMDKIRRADRTYYFIRPPDEPSAPRRRVRVKIDYDRELRDLANKAAAYSEMLEGCNVVGQQRKRCAEACSARDRISAEIRAPADEVRRR